MLLANSLPLLSQHEVVRRLCLVNGFSRSTMDGAHEDAENVSTSYVIIVETFLTLPCRMKRPP